MLNPPAQAARSATLPLILTRDRLVLGIAVNQSSGQAAQVVGYMAGAVIAAYNARLALLINAATFLTSAIILRYGVRDRPPAMLTEYRSRLVREAGDGFRIVFGTPALRAIAMLVFASMLFSIVPEGLAIGWASQLAEGERQRGLYQGLIMVANPVGYLLGGLLIARLVPPAVRRRLIRVFAVVAPLALVPAVWSPPVGGVIAMTVICGFAVAGMMPATNALFVQALPNGFRARAFGVMQSGVQVTQGVAVLATGLLAGAFPLPVVVGLWSLAGVGLMIVVASRWPRPEVFTAAIDNAEEANAAALAYEPRHARPGAPRPLPPAHNPAGV
jgi:MFS family permease